ncbi:MAG: membrane protein insertion efficiency factor YidD [Chlamydiales bacterium]|nr:membrane protein insertion efficiency factor YidD [Chlamydiales bacterium]
MTCPAPSIPPKRPAYNVLLVNMINFHQQVISKADGPRSHYYPGSSEYTKQAIIKYGFFRGYIMGCDRLMRENGELWTYPRHYIWHEWKKYDPVK